jgi:hypothetical protein
MIEHAVSAELERKRSPRANAQRVAIWQRAYVVRVLDSVANHTPHRQIIKSGDTHLKLRDRMI